MAEMPDFNVRDVMRESGATLIVNVKVKRDWRFKVGWRLVRWGVWLMGMAARLDDTK